MMPIVNTRVTGIAIARTVVTVESKINKITSQIHEQLCLIINVYNYAFEFNYLEYLCVRVHICMCVYMYVCVCMCAYICMHACMYVCRYTCTCVCVNEYNNLLYCILKSYTRNLT